MTNISRSKGNQAINETCSVHRIQTWIAFFFWKTILDQLSNLLYSLFLLYAKFRAIKIYWSKAADRLLLPHIKLFQKTKKRPETSLSASVFLLLYSVNWPNLIVWLPLLCEILDSMSIVILCFPGYDVTNFNLIFLFKPFFFQILISWERKELLRWNKKQFLSFLKGFHSNK